MLSPIDKGQANLAQEEAMPLPADPQVIYLGGLFLLALLAVLYVAAEIVWPLVFAFILSLLFKPVQRLLRRLHIPALVSALLIVFVLLGLVVGLGTAVSGPAATWAAKLPEGIPRLIERLRFVEAPLAALQQFWHQLESFAGWQEGASSSVGGTLIAHLFTGTSRFASGFFTTLLFLFFSSSPVKCFCSGWWRSCRVSAANVRSSTSRNRSRRISLRIW